MNAAIIQNPWPTYVVLLLSCFITMEASAFQAPAIPSIARHFEVSAGLSAMISLIYYLGVIVFSPISGRLADSFGRKRMLVIGLSVFAASEFLAALVTNFSMLLVARFVQGACVGCILPCVLSYAGYLFPPQKRGMPLGVLVFAMGLGATTGALIGGYLIDWLGWRSIYWVSGVLALVGLVVLQWRVPETPTSSDPYRLDWKGAVLLLIAVGAFLSFPTWIGRFGFVSWQALTALGVGLIGFAVLWLLEQKTEVPVLDIGILRQRNFIVPGLLYLLFLIVYGGTIYSLVFFVNDRPGGSASHGGMITMFTYGASMLAGLISGKLVDRFNERSVILGIVALMTCGLWLYTTLATDTPLWLVAFIATVLGFGQGMKGPAITKLAMSTLPPNRMSAGSGLFSMMRDFGTPLGVSIGLALYGATEEKGTEATVLDRMRELGVEEHLLPMASQALASKGAAIAVELQERLTALGTDFSTVLASSKVEGMAGALPQVGAMLFGVLFLAMLLAFFLPKGGLALGEAKA
jgi:multidrug resistance protein